MGARGESQACPEMVELSEDTLLLAREEYFEVLSILCMRHVSIIREMYTFRLMGGPVIIICAGSIVIDTAKSTIQSVGMRN